MIKNATIKFKNNSFKLIYKLNVPSIISIDAEMSKHLFLKTYYSKITNCQINLSIVQ